MAILCRNHPTLPRRRSLGHLDSDAADTGKMPKQSAGLLMFRRRGPTLEVLLVHPGGPFWARKDLAAWSIPKGEYQPGEDPLAAARREFAEETGITPRGDFVALAPIRQPGGKIVRAWAVESDCDPQAIQSNTFTMEWPPRSGRQQTFPEVDRAEWFPLALAGRKISKGQARLLAELVRLLSERDRLEG
jgi:predicted NUDIX family NTP pyrophosphohydrolase